MVTADSRELETPTPATNNASVKTLFLKWQASDAQYFAISLPLF
jgi:hypothetical protein